MELGELIRRFRVEADDKAEPYFIETEDVKAWLNDAVKEACIRGRLLHESSNDAVCKIAVTAGSAHYPLHESLYEITRIWFVPTNGDVSHPLSLVSTGELDRIHYNNWAEQHGKPGYAVQTDTSIRLVPMPDVDGTIAIEGYRVPITEMVTDSDQPEINKIHHEHLIQWVLHKAFSVVDAEFFDPNRAGIAEQAFTDYFGARPDSDLRRITREDTPQNVQPFMP